MKSIPGSKVLVRVGQPSTIPSAPDGSDYVDVAWCHLGEGLAGFPARPAEREPVEPDTSAMRGSMTPHPGNDNADCASSRVRWKRMPAAGVLERATHEPSRRLQR
jgi:hypothetical protein